MGWLGYGLYAGDGTQSCHADFLRTSLIIQNEKDEDQINMSITRGTQIPKNKQHLLTENIDLILKKMPKLFRGKFWNENNAIEWQMLLALFADNRIRPPRQVRKMGIEATEYLMYEHAEGFNQPSRRRQALRNFLKKVENLK